MKTTKELIADLENAPKRKGVCYVHADDLADAIILLKAFSEACEALRNMVRLHLRDWSEE